jgi:hypothetical protein
VKPNKIVAGHEPEKTNEFLQILATAINANVSKITKHSCKLEKYTE